MVVGGVSLVLTVSFQVGFSRQLPNLAEPAALSSRKRLASVIVFLCLPTAAAALSNEPAVYLGGPWEGEGKVKPAAYLAWATKSSIPQHHSKPAVS